MNLEDLSDKSFYLFILVGMFIQHLRVEHNIIKSEYIPITTGAPQGYILGPLLFIIYLNYISFSSNFLKFIVCADDTTLFANFSNLNKGNKLNK